MKSNTAPVALPRFLVDLAFNDKMLALCCAHSRKMSRAMHAVGAVPQMLAGLLG